MKYFHNPFKKKICPKCDSSTNELNSTCRVCKNEFETDDPRIRSFNNNLPIGPIRELILFVIGSAGLFIIAQLIGTAALFIKTFEFTASGLTGEELTNAVKEYSSSVSLTVIMNDLTYALIFVGMLLFLWRDNRRLWKSFANFKVLLGIPIFLGMMVLSSIWSMIATKLGATTNINQSTVVSTVVSYPFLAVIITGLVAPFVEELTYRVGAFTFLKRINRVLAYVVVGALFGLIHIKDFTSANEWLSYPSYVIAGLCLCFAYDMFGFGTSFTAHALNNLVSVVSILLEASKK